MAPGLGQASARRSAPLPLREGYGPTRVRLPPARSGTVEELLRPWFTTAADAEGLAARFAAGEIVDGGGQPLAPGTPLAEVDAVWLYRDPPAEEPVVPFELTVLNEDEHLLVIDKPHFLAVTPRGSHVRQTVLARLRAARSDLPELSPAHRLDRATAGVLVLVKWRRDRGAYQRLFEQRLVSKTYEAVAASLADVPEVGAPPRVIASRIVKEGGWLQAREVPGPPNAVTRIVKVRELPGSRAEYRLWPQTGRTHQLRVHMAAIGAPIVGDELYPEVDLREADDFSQPLALVARSIEFTDPLDGTPQRFTSPRTLNA